MSLVQIRKEGYVSKQNHKVTKRILVLKCDNCSGKFERKYSKYRMTKEKHFCCRECAESSGWVRQRISDGVSKYRSKETPEQRAIRAKKHSRSWKKTFSEKSDLQKRLENEKRSKSLVVWWGKKDDKEKETIGKNRSAGLTKYYKEVSSDDLSDRNNKIGKTNKMIWDNKTEDELKEYSELMSVVNKRSWANKTEEEMIEFRGKCSDVVSEIWKNRSDEERKAIGDKISNSIKRYVANRTEEERSEFRKTMSNALSNRPQEEKIRSSKKRHQTMKRNGTYGKSKFEDKVYDVLCSIFGDDNIERQVKLFGKSIDFYVEPYDVYVEADGIYWHGLNRPLSVIMEFKNKRDKIIYETYLRDRALDFSCQINNVTLLRITDEMFYKRNNR